eukprot:142737-Hanusia_phi.AAC.5
MTEFPICQRRIFQTMIAYLLILVFMVQTGISDDSNGLCSFGEKLEGKICESLQFDENSRTSRQCADSCCLEQDCQIWQYHLDEGCWKGSQADVSCSAAEERWVGERTRTQLSRQSTLSEKSEKILEWRRRRGMLGDCCPSRWCCPSGCCPPRMLVNAHSEPWVDNRLLVDPSTFEESVALLAEEAQAGMIRFCITFEVFIESLQTTIHVEKGSEILRVALSACNGSDRSKTHDSIERCLQTVVFKLVRGGVEHFLNMSHPFILFAPQLEIYSSVDACRASRLTATSWYQVNSLNLSRRLHGPRNAFRWLKPQDDGGMPISMVPRHARGQARTIRT